MRGVRYTESGARTRSIVMRSRSGTMRTVESRHSLTKLARSGALTRGRGCLAAAARVWQPQAIC